MRREGYIPRNNKDTKLIITPDNRKRRRDTILTVLTLDYAAYRGLSFELSLRSQSICILRERLLTAPNPYKRLYLFIYYFLFNVKLASRGLIKTPSYRAI